MDDERGSLAVREPKTFSSRRRWIFRGLPPVIILLVGLLASRYFTTHRPSVEKRKPRPALTLVEVQQVDRRTTHATISAMGTVVPAQGVTLRSQVSGMIIQVSDRFVEGAMVKEGEELLRIDPADYELSLAEAGARLVEAESELHLEQGRQTVALREWELLRPEGSVSDEERRLALRGPHLEQVKARVISAEAAVRKAKLDLERTVIRAPFNAVLTQRHTNLGDQATPQGALADLAGTDVSWVRVAIPQDRLDWLIVPRVEGDPASSARIVLRSGDENAQEWSGSLILVLGAVEEQGRMAEVLIEVNDPFGLERPESSLRPLLLNSYVRVEIRGRSIQRCVYHSAFCLAG